MQLCHANVQASNLDSKCTSHVNMNRNSLNNNGAVKKDVVENSNGQQNNKERTHLKSGVRACCNPILWMICNNNAGMEPKI